MKTNKTYTKEDMKRLLKEGKVKFVNFSDIKKIDIPKGRKI